MGADVTKLNTNRRDWHWTMWIILKQQCRHARTVRWEKITGHTGGLVRAHIVNTGMRQLSLNCTVDGKKKKLGVLYENKMATEKQKQILDNASQYWKNLNSILWMFISPQITAVTGMDMNYDNCSFWWWDDVCVSQAFIHFHPHAS